MYKVENLYPHYKQAVKIEWNLGKRCNYDCSYCPTEIHDNHSEHQDITVLKNTADKLTTLITNKKLRISFTGGEPCVHPNLVELLQHIRPKVSWINITSNGTRTAEYYQKLLSEYVDHMVFSVHLEYNYKRVLDSIIKAYKGSNNKNVLVHLMMLPGRLNDVKTVCAQLKGIGIRYALRPIRWTESHDNFVDMEKYSKAERKFLDKENHTPPKNTIIDGSRQCNVNDLLIEKINHFKGWQCQAGVESLMINWDGEVHRATCRVGGSLGNIYNNTFILPTEFIVCTRDWCTCAADINITKEKTCRYTA